MENQRICTKCKTLKLILEFPKDKTRKLGHGYLCKKCSCNKRKKYYYNNKEKNNLCHKKWATKNKEKLKKYNKNYREKNKEKISYIRNKRSRKRRKHDNLYKFKCNVSGLINVSFKRKSLNKDIKSVKILGCSILFFRDYIESKFKPGMTWDNHSITGWHLDHIIPISIAKTKEEVIRLNHYTNFQPLWSKENIIKSNKLCYNYEN